MHGFRTDQINTELEETDQWLRSQIKKFKSEFTQFGVDFGFDFLPLVIFPALSDVEIVTVKFSQHPLSLMKIMMVKVKVRKRKRMTRTMKRMLRFLKDKISFHSEAVAQTRDTSM
jgi:hypothetical protein